MKLTTFKCATCGGAIQLNDIANHLIACPFCGNNFYVDEEWNESVKATTKHTQEILVKNIRDIEIPEVTDSVTKSDLEIFRKINESIVSLKDARSNLETCKNENNQAIHNIECKVGLDYEELTSKTPPLNVDGALGLSYTLAAIVVFILCCIDGHVITGIFLAVFWPILLLSGEVGTPLLVFVGSTILILLLQGCINISFFRKLDNAKVKLDSKRIEERTRMLKENVYFSADIDLLSKTISELDKLKHSAGILKSTSQFNGLSSADIIKKINFALRRMDAAPIDFETACTGLNIKNESLGTTPIELDSNGNAKDKIERALTYINS